MLNKEYSIAVMRYQNFLKNRVGVNPDESGMYDMFLDNYANFLRQNMSKTYAQTQLSLLKREF